ncbi:hypothetical protein B0H16DRAFT_1450769 [Mycena metata]|uniref:Uncharacterized protein n=1 Tax=Mycena metata TaxID=1033252 RepID=A0AAD7JXI8_9AGAR|nr:hypothetical protein B0H16DRAFT_1450769 [Mycena metata]
MVRYGSDTAYDCYVVNPEFGECTWIEGGTATHNPSGYGGAPTPYVLQIASPPSMPLKLPPVPSGSTTQTTSSSTSSSTPLPIPTLPSNSKHSTPVGPIVGAVIATLALLLGGLWTFIFLRRRRQHQIWEDAKTAARPYAIDAVESGNTLPANPVPVSGPQADPRRSSHRLKGHERGGGTVSAPTPSATVPVPSASDNVGVNRAAPIQELPTSELLQLLAQRIQREEEAPPYALV